MTVVGGFRAASRCATKGGVPRRSFRVALVVETVVNLIHQGYAVLGQGIVVWSKLLPTYRVPRRVATQGAVTAKQRMAERGQ